MEKKYEKMKKEKMKNEKGEKNETQGCRNDRK